MGPDTSLTPELIQAQSFTSGFRGYDPGEVKTFLTRVANELRAWRERAEGLESAWHSAEERAARPPVLDEDTLMAAVGEETATILRTARAAAADLRTKAAEEAERTRSEALSESERMLQAARTEAERVLGEATTEAARLRGDAEAALGAASAAAEEMANGLLAAARQEAAELVQRATDEAEDTRTKAEKDRQLTIEGANSTRDRILEDLSRRRRVATVQIEQLRAGRERLIESYAMVRRTLEEVQSELSRADAEARAAADDVGRRLRDEPEVELSESTRLFGGDSPDHGGGDGGAATGGPADVLVVESVEVVEAVGGADEADAAAAADTADAGVEDARGPVPEASVPQAEAVAADEPPGSAVDELFARIRATRAGLEAAAGSAGPAPGPDAVDVTDTPAAGPTAESGKVESTDADQASGKKRFGRGGGSRPANGHPRPAPAAAQGGVTVVEMGPSDPPVSNTDETLLQSRESAVVDLEVALTRRLKRTLQDEQNDVLDRLRGVKGAPTVETLLPDTSAQVGRYAGAARSLLADAAAAGAVFADETLGRPGRDAPVEVDVSDLADDCGRGIVSALRRRLEQAIETGEAEDQAVLVESLGAAYREWKTQRIERLAGDVLSAAFSRGTWQATPEGARLRWVVEDADGPCPDCDDDALAGDLPKGEAFPTGQPYPPAHSGCRCLLVPSAPRD